LNFFAFRFEPALPDGRRGSTFSGSRLENNEN